MTASVYMYQCNGFSHIQTISGGQILVQRTNDCSVLGEVSY